MSDDEDLLSRKESAAFLRVSVSTFDRLRKLPGFPRPTMMSPSLQRWRRGALRRWLERRTPPEDGQQAA